jgi:dihydropteroate synthase
MQASLALPGGRFLPLDGRALVMGIVNVTPDSFFPGSRRPGMIEARDAALAMAAAGAAIVDIGGESTRPGSDYVGVDEELERVVPVVEAIRLESDLAISIDTRKSAVASAALDAGADIVNDISALANDPEMAALVASRGACVVLMHMLGEPKTMQVAPVYVDCPSEVRAFLLEAAARARAAGIARDKIVLDPGIGFGKRLEDNLAILSRLDELVEAGYPVLVGLSRKAFLGAVTGRQVEGRLSASLGAACAAFAEGARIFRVHDVAETVDALAAFAAARSRASPTASVRPAEAAS